MTMKRIWVEYSRIFGIEDFHLPQLDNLLLDGEFDKLLPVIQNPDEIKNEEPARSNKWYHSWEVINIPNSMKYGDNPQCKSYWEIVAGQMLENVRKHISLDIDTRIDCFVIDGNSEWFKRMNSCCSYLYSVTDTFAWMNLTISINKVLGENCMWHDIGDPYIMRYGSFSVNPTPTINIIFKIEKTDVNL